jgi:histidinol-phosphatase (PHP family)
LFDNHVHTRFSADSAAEPRDAIGAARAAGLSGIVFTDHWDIGYKSFNAGNMEPRQYSRGEIRDYRTSGGGFSVFVGIELGPTPAVRGEVDAAMAGAGFDFVLLSAHYAATGAGTPSETLYPQCEYGALFERLPKPEAHAAYLETLISLVDAYGDFDALGHFDYVSRYSPYEDPLMRYRDCAGQFDALFGRLIARGKALEINTATYRRLGRRFPLDKDIVRRYAELGGELLCLGSDAHRAQDVGCLFGEFRDVLLSCGVRALAHFEQRKPVVEKL